MLEAQQRNVPGGDLTGMVDIAGDAPGVQFRLMLKRMVDAENSEVTS